ncbi:MAG: citrate/2-methylcitrate synthase [Georgenia sp.]
MTLTSPPPDRAGAVPIFTPDEASGMPAYRGVDVSSLVGTPFDEVWGLLVDGVRTPLLPPAEPFNLPVRTGDVRVDVQSALAQLTAVWSFRPLHEIPAAEVRENLVRASVMACSFVAQSARGDQVPAVPQREIDLVSTAAERFLVRWRGAADPVAVAALDMFWLVMAENGLVPSTRTARLAAEVGTDVASCLAAAVAVASGPFGGGAVARGLALVERAERDGDCAAVVSDYLATHPSLPGFGDVALPLDNRVMLLRDACVRLGARHVEVADEFVRAAREALAVRAPAGEPATRPNALFWGAILLDHAGVAPNLMSAMYMCARTAGWSAHVLEVRRQL